MGKAAKTESKVVVVESTENATIPCRDYMDTDSEIVQMAKQHGSLANTLAKYAEQFSRTVSMFRCVLYWIYLEVEWEITNEVPDHLRMTPADAAEYIKHVLECNHNPYNRRGKRVDRDDPSEGFVAVSQRSKHVANLCSYFSGKTKIGIPLVQLTQCGTIAELQKVSSTPTKTEKREAMTDSELLHDHTTEFIRQEAVKLINENNKFATAVAKLLSEYGKKVPVMEIQQTRKVVKK